MGKRTRCPNSWTRWPSHPVAERRVLTALPPEPPPEPSYIILGPGRLGFMSGPPPAPFDGPRATRRWPVRRWPRRAIP